MMKTTHMKYMGYAIAAAVLLLYGCVSERDTVSVRQVESKAFIVLRAGEGRKNIFSLKYPLAFEFRKNVRRKIYYFDSSYFAKNDELCPGTGECRIEANDNDEYLTDKYKNSRETYYIQLKETIQCKEPYQSIAGLCLKRKRIRYTYRWRYLRKSTVS